MMLTLSFSLQSVIILEGRRDTLFTTTNEKDSNANRIFTADDGLQFAIGIIDYGTEDYTDVEGRNFDEYLELYVYNWYFTQDTSAEVPESFEIKSHICTEEELGLLESSDSNSSKFYPHSESGLSAIKERSQVFHCFD